MENRNPVPNGEKIRELRERAGMTQDKLGIMSNVDRRTIQRAEVSKPMQMESLSSIASALNVPLPQILGSSNGRDDYQAEELLAQSLIVLRPVQSGMALINSVCGSFDAKISCEAEPNVDNIEVLTAFIEGVEGIMPDPWRAPIDEPGFVLSARLRMAVGMNEQIKQLEEFGISVFTGIYTAKTQIPRYDLDEGHMYVTNTTPFEQVTICRIMVAAAKQDRITLKVDDLYVPPKASSLEATDTEDMPF